MLVLGLGLGLDSVGRLGAIRLYTCVRYLHYSTTTMTVTLLIYLGPFGFLMVSQFTLRRHR